MFNNNKKITEGFSIGSATPIDDRLIFNNLDFLNLPIFSRYENLEVKVFDFFIPGTKGLYTSFFWKEINPNQSILASHHIYGLTYTYSGNIINNVDYSNKTFAWVYKKNYYEELITFFVNTPVVIQHDLLERTPTVKILDPNNLNLEIKDFETRYLNTNELSIILNNSLSGDYIVIIQN